MRIVGYSYNAALHCPYCARQDQHMGRITWGGVSLRELCATTFDAQGVAVGAIDREGNEVRPVFSTDEHPDGPPLCDDCCRELE